MKEGNHNKVKFWLSDLSALFNKTDYLKIVPKKSYSRNQQLNSITRLAIYHALIVLALSLDTKWIYISLVLIALSMLIFVIDNQDPKSSQKKLKIFKEPDNEYTQEQIEQYQDDTCRKPTYDNPFMNLNKFDLNKENVPQACNADDEDIKKDIEVNFEKNLFRDVGDVWEKKNAERIFYTTPNTSVPNKQIEFARWLYNVPASCKQDQERCLKYQDMRRVRNSSHISLKN
jgi:hypothetical protein